MTMRSKIYGWRPDLPDHRDHRFGVVQWQDLAALPAKVDLTPQCPSVLDQGQLGSCTANAIANCYRFTAMKEALSPVVMPSRLFVYYNERAIEGTTRDDAGAEIRDGFKSIAGQGVCDESLWPYVITKFARQPPKQCYAQAVTHEATEYQRLDNADLDLDQLRKCLADGYPFVFGFTVYEAFESAAVAKSGIVPMPKKKEKSLGGHAVLAVGYDDAKRRFTVMNSWGTSWGRKGFFTIPYDYLISPDLADDFWTLRLVK